MEIAIKFVKKRVRLMANKPFIYLYCETGNLPTILHWINGLNSFQNSLGALEDLAIFVGAHVPAQSGLGLVGLAALVAEEGLFVGVFHHVSCEVGLAAAGVRAQGTLEGFDALVHPDVLLQVRVGTQENTAAVRALERTPTWNRQEYLRLSQQDRFNTYTIIVLNLKIFSTENFKRISSITPGHTVLPRIHHTLLYITTPMSRRGCVVSTGT